MLNVGGLENFNVEADPADTRGKPPPRESGKRLYPRGSTGVETTACTEGDNRKHGKPQAVAGRCRQPDAREGQAGPRGVTERLVVAMKPGNSGRAKGPQFKDNAGSSEGPGHWRKPNNPIRPGVVGSVARDREESLGHERLVCLSVLPCPRAGCGKSACPVRRAGTGNGVWQTDIAPQTGKP